jgi:hypothetical protein
MMRRPAILLRFTTDPVGGETAPVVRVRNAAEAQAAAASSLAREGIAWQKPEAVESLGILGYRLWFASSNPDAALRPVDVRLDGKVHFTTG